MCDCFQNIIFDTSIENKVDDKEAKVWLNDYIRVTFRKWISNKKDYSSRITEKKYAIHYCPFCGDKLPERKDRTLNSLHMFE